MSRCAPDWQSAEAAAEAKRLGLDPAELVSAERRDRRALRHSTSATGG